MLKQCKNRTKILLKTLAPTSSHQPVLERSLQKRQPMAGQ